MLKLLILLPVLIVGSVLLSIGALMFVPLLALAPIALALCAGFFAFALTAGILVLIVRIVGAIVFGLGGLILGGVGLAVLLAGGAAFLALGLVFAHLLLPLLLIVGVVWLIQRSHKPLPPAQIAPF